LVEEAAVATTAAIEWKITVEGTDVLGEVRRHEIRIDKAWDRSYGGWFVKSGFQHLVVSPGWKGRKPWSRTARDRWSGGG